MPIKAKPFFNKNYKGILIINNKLKRRQNKGSAVGYNFVITVFVSLMHYKFASRRKILIAEWAFKSKNVCV
jgi:hypothetical protein